MQYDDIINLPRPQSTRPHMSLLDRAAQFAPFAALHGHSAIISHTADRHVSDITTPQFEDDCLLSLLSEQEYEE